MKISVVVLRCEYDCRLIVNVECEDELRLCMTENYGVSWKVSVGRYVV